MDFESRDLNPEEDSDWSELEAGNTNSFLEVDRRDSNPDLLGLGSVPFDSDSRDSTEDSDEFDVSEWNMEAGNANSGDSDPDLEDPDTNPGESDPDLPDFDFLQVDPRGSNPDLLGLGSVPFDPDSRDSTEDSDELLDLESDPLDVDSDPLNADSRDSTEDSDELLDLESDPLDSDS